MRSHFQNENSRLAGFGLIGLIVAVAAIAALAGAGWYWKKTQPQRPPVQQLSQPDISDWKTYRNERYGYSIRYPSTFTAYAGVDQQKERVIPPSLDSEQVFLTNNPARLFCCEPLVSSVSVIKGRVDVKNWKQHAAIPDYRIQRQGDITFVGKNAFEVKASAGLDSPAARLIIISGELHSFILIQGDSGELWDAITNSFLIL